MRLIRRKVFIPDCQHGLDRLGGQAALSIRLPHPHCAITVWTVHATELI